MNTRLSVNNQLPHIPLRKRDHTFECAHVTTLAFECAHVTTLAFECAHVTILAFECAHVTTLAFECAHVNTRLSANNQLPHISLRKRDHSCLSVRM